MTKGRLSEIRKWWQEVGWHFFRRQETFMFYLSDCSKIIIPRMTFFPIRIISEVFNKFSLNRVTRTNDLCFQKMIETLVKADVDLFPWMMLHPIDSWKTTFFDPNPCYRIINSFNFQVKSLLNRFKMPISNGTQFEPHGKRYFLKRSWIISVILLFSMALRITGKWASNFLHSYEANPHGFPSGIFFDFILILVYWLGAVLLVALFMENENKPRSSTCIHHQAAAISNRYRIALINAYHYFA